MISTVSWPRLGLLLIAGLVLACPGMAEDAQVKPIRFKPGQTQLTVQGVLKGRNNIDFRLHALAGQTMRVNFKATNPNAYFNVLPPGSTSEAMFVGSTGGDEWTGKLTTDGNYTIRAYLMRNAARRNESGKFTLIVSLNASTMGQALANDAKVRGTPYHATGTVPCSIGAEAIESKRCEFGVIRGNPGQAELHVQYPGHDMRVLTFRNGGVTTNGQLRVSKSDDLWSIEVDGSEHYQVPEAVIVGG